jgi:hypothetical protein
MLMGRRPFRAFRSASGPLGQPAPMGADVLQRAEADAMICVHPSHALILSYRKA